MDNLLVDSTPRLSIVVCTYNRAAMLSCALDALVRQTMDPDTLEIVVVDNNSTDWTAEIVRERAARHPRIRYLFEARQGLPIARNSGVLAAHAPLIAFTDDDVEVAPDWAAVLVATFEEYPGVGYVGGKVVPVWNGTRPAWIPDTHYGPLALQDRGDRAFSVGSHDARPCLIGANFAVRRGVFDRVGLFSPSFPWGEDREFQLRAWDAGVCGHYLPEAVAICRVPAERVTKRYQREWFAKAGRVHARMHLMERMDRNGRLIPPVAGPRVFGVPHYLLRELAREVGRWIGAAVRLNGADTFRAESRVRYLASYAAQCGRRVGAWRDPAAGSTLTSTLGNAHEVRHAVSASARSGNAAP